MASAISMVQKKHLSVHNIKLIAPLQGHQPRCLKPACLQACMYPCKGLCFISKYFDAGKYTYEMLREGAHSHSLETCAEYAAQRTPECIPVFHQSDHQELGSTVSHPFDKHLHTYSMIMQQH